MPFPARLEIPEQVLEIARTLDRAGHEVWCVGGAVRDALLGVTRERHNLEASEIDFATSATPDQVQALFRRTVAVGVKYGTVGVIDRDRALHEVTTFRRDVSTDGRHAVVAYGVSLDDDLARRDFTINAIAYHPLKHEWRDPFGGADDLARGLVRAVGVPAQRFREDYLRILRAVRFAVRFDFRIDPATWDAAREAVPGLAQLSAERVRDEWFKALQSARSVTHAVQLWHDVGAAAQWIPELGPADPATAGYSQPAVDAEPRNPVLLVCVLCRQPSLVLRRLRASGAEIARADAIARGPAEPAGADPTAVRRWLAQVGGAADDLMALWSLRHGTAAPWAGTVRESRAKREATSRSALALDGNDLIALGVPRGPRLGEALDLLLDRVLADPAANTREHLSAIVRALP